MVALVLARFFVEDGVITRTDPMITQGCDMEVLEPKWFRDELAEIAKQMWNNYKRKK